MERDKAKKRKSRDTDSESSTSVAVRRVVVDSTNLNAVAEDAWMVIRYSRVLFGKVFAGQAVLKAYEELSETFGEASSVNTGDNYKDYCMHVMFYHVQKMMKMHPFYSNYVRDILLQIPHSAVGLRKNQRSLMEVYLKEVVDKALEIQNTLAAMMKSCTEAFEYSSKTRELRRNCLLTIERSLPSPIHNREDDVARKKELVRKKKYQIKWMAEVMNRLFVVFPFDARNDKMVNVLKTTNKVVNAIR